MSAIKNRNSTTRINNIVKYNENPKKHEIDNQKQHGVCVMIYYIMELIEINNIIFFYDNKLYEEILKLHKKIVKIYDNNIENVYSVIIF